MASVDPTLRAGRPDDAPALHALYVQAFRGSTLPFTVHADPRSVSWLAEVLERQPPAAGVLDGDGDLLGAFEGALFERDWHLNHVAVRAEARGRGLGRRLLQGFERWGCERGAATFSLHVVEAKADVAAWYARHGYRVEERRVHLVLDVPVRPGRDPSFELPQAGLAEALISVTARGFGRLTASCGARRLEVGLLGDDSCRLLDPGELSVEEAVAEVRALFAGRRSRLVLIGQPREPRVDGVLEAWPALRMVKPTGLLT
jgi:ribosomal protein S18 acetylase RimI-like enzyme